MSQNFETRHQTNAMSPGMDKQRIAPGILPAAAMTVLAGLACGIWLTSGVATETVSPGSDPNVSELAQVDNSDIPAALSTMNGSGAELVQYKERAGSCPRPLAWISLARVPGQPPSTVRLRSGGYFSPIFELSDVPVRVAVPYPAPYELGHGTLTVMDAGGGAVISLVPPWSVPAQSSGATREVHWNPTNHCKPSNG
jgi:hypothetical protein